METNKNKKFKPSDIFAENILISQNTDFNELAQNFIRNLENKYHQFKENQEKEKEKWSKIEKQKNVFIFPEKLSIKSPLTILNAPWGTGKTHFIENIALNWQNILNNPDIKTFKNFIVLDTWRFVSSEKISESIASEIYWILLKIIEVDKAKKRETSKKLLKIFVRILPKLILTTNFIISLASPYNDIDPENLKLLYQLSSEIRSGFENKKEGEEETKFDIFKEIEKINKDIKPTIIVFDNVERMGDHAWDIIKTIQALSVFDNLIFILPLNKTQLRFTYTETNYEDRNESAIDKYITFGSYYNLKQDYLGLLLEKGFSNELASTINDILNEEIEGYKLSIRTIENWLNTKKIKNIFEDNKYKGLKELKLIWDSNWIEEILQNDIKIIENIWTKIENVIKTRSNFFEDDNYKNIFNFLNRNQQEPWLDFNLEKNDYYEKFTKINEEIGDNWKIKTKIDFDWLEEWNGFINLLKGMENHLKSKKDKLENKLLELENKIFELKKNNEDLTFEIEKVSNDLKGIENKSILSVDDSKTKANIQNQIKIHSETKTKNEKSLNDLEIEKQSIQKVFDDLTKNISIDKKESKLKKLILEFEEFYKKLKKEFDLLHSEHNTKYLWNKILKSVKSFKKTDENYYASRNSIFEDENTILQIIKSILYLED